MVENYVLTQKLSRDAFVCEAVDLLSHSVRPGGGWKSVYFMNPFHKGKEHYRAQRIFHGESPHDRRVIDFPTEKNRKEEPIARYRVVLTPCAPPSRQEMREPRILFVNAPIPWSEVHRIYPAAMIAGYAENQQEEEILRDVSSVDNPVFFRAPDYYTKTSDVMREFPAHRFLHTLEDNCIAEPLTTETAERIAVEGLRRRLVRNVDAFKAAERGSIHQHCVFLAIASDMDRYLDIQKIYVQQCGFEQGIQNLWAGSPLTDCIQDFVKSMKLLSCIGGFRHEEVQRKDDHDTVHHTAMAFREGYGALVEHAYASNVRVPQGIFGELLKEPDNGIFNVSSKQNEAKKKERELAVA